MYTIQYDPESEALEDIIAKTALKQKYSYNLYHS